MTFNTHLDENIDRRHIIVQLPWVKRVRSTSEGGTKNKCYVGSSHLVFCIMQRNAIKEAEEKSHDSDDLRRERVDGS